MAVECPLAARPQLNVRKQENCFVLQAAFSVSMVETRYTVVSRRLWEERGFARHHPGLWLRKLASVSKEQEGMGNGI